MKVIVTRASDLTTHNQQPCEGALLDANPIVIQIIPNLKLDAVTIGNLLALSGGLVQVTKKTEALSELQRPGNYPVWYLQFGTLEELLAFINREGKVVICPEPRVYLDGDYSNKLPYRDYPYELTIYDYYLE